MKFFNKKTISAGLLSTVLLLSACTELTDGFSTDPVNTTNPSVISTQNFAAGMLMNLIGTYEADISRLTGMWSGYFSGEDRQYIGLANYGVSGRDFDTEWGGIYANVIKNATIVKSRAKDSKNAWMTGLAQTAEAMAAGLAADLWGDVPYSEMAQFPAIATPKYDAQADVYAKVQVLLDSAIANFSVDAADIPNKLQSEVANADFYFGGDTDAWIAVCHTLKARFYLHTRAYTDAVAEAIQGIATDAGNMEAPHGSSYLQNFNLYYSFMNYDRPGYMGANSYAPALIDSTVEGNRTNAKTNENARLNYLYLPGAGVYIAGAYEPNFISYADGWVADPSEDGFFGTTTSFPMVTYQENQLILAEAYAKSGDSPSALAALNDYRTYLDGGGYWNSAYQDGYGHMYLQYDAADFDNGGIENEDGIDPDDALLREILEERYVTFIGQLEGYNDIRRTGNLLGIPVKAGNTVMPLRLLYSQGEINTNPNVPTSGVGLFDPTPVNSTPY